MEITRRIKLGIVANEFFDLSSGGKGGFGWAARQVATCFNACPNLGVDVVFLSRDIFKTLINQTAIQVHGTKLIPPADNMNYWRQIRAEKLDVMLSIDYRPSYEPLFKRLPRTPIIVWVRDPRTPYDA